VLLTTSPVQRGSPTGQAMGSGLPSATWMRTGTRTSTSQTTESGTSCITTRGTETFADVAFSAGVGFDGNGKPQAGIGTEIADYDGDGLPDIFVTNFSEELNTLYRNLGKLFFEDVSERAGLGSGYLPLGFGTKLFDYD